MSRRTYTIPLRCAEPGCRESSICEAIGRDEYAEARARYGRNPWRCSRHRKPDEVLSVENLERQTVVELTIKSFGHSWDIGTTCATGPGFKAFADDFPPGTRLIITAHIELPDAQQAIDKENQ